MQIEVVPYNENWVQQFQNESAKIKDQLGNVMHNIHHIGSTSIPGMYAKPIIDMILVVKSLIELDKVSNLLETASSRERHVQRLGLDVVAAAAGRLLVCNTNLILCKSKFKFV